MQREIDFIVYQYLLVRETKVAYLKFADSGSKKRE